MEQHVKCSFCDNVMEEGLIEDHELTHIELNKVFYKGKVFRLKTQEEIAQWINERKKKYPRGKWHFPAVNTKHEKPKTVLETLLKQEIQADNVMSLEAMLFLCQEKYGVPKPKKREYLSASEISLCAKKVCFD